MCFQEAVIIRWTNAICESDNKMFVVHVCRLKAIKRYVTALNLNGTLLKPANDIRVRVQIQKKANGFKPWLIDLRSDVCQFLRKNNNPIMKMMYNVFRDRSNINHTCPFMGPVIVKDLYLTPDLMPLPIPTGEYSIIINWTLNQVSQVYTNYHIEFIEDL
ncbi:hypothetical protein KR044_008544 [Drosophila immigrans]|nr:hypothetical protein KR044_008544 [Drosophila immigrans]